jgi:hypothetical protein
MAARTVNGNNFQLAGIPIRTVGTETTDPPYVVEQDASEVAVGGSGGVTGVGGGNGGSMTSFFYSSSGGDDGAGGPPIGMIAGIFIGCVTFGLLLLGAGLYWRVVRERRGIANANVSSEPNQHLIAPGRARSSAPESEVSYDEVQRI